MKRGTARTALVVLGAGRVAIGGALLARPQLLARTLGVDSVTAGRVEWLTRTTGVRDLVIGLGTVRAAASGADVRDWVHAGATSDAVDAVVLGAAAAERRVGPMPGAAIALAALAGAVLQVRAWRALAAPR